MASGAVVSLDNDKASYKSLAWSEKGEALAVLKGKEDKAYEDKLWSVVAFSGFQDPKGPRKTVYDPAADKSFPEGMTVSPDRSPAWTDSFDAVLFGIHEAKKKKDADKKRRRTPAAAPAPEGRGARRRGHPRPGHLARPGQAPPVGAAGPGTVRQELQLSRRIPGRREEVHPSGRRRGPRRRARRPSSASPSARTSGPTSSTRNLDGRNFSDVFVIDLKTGKRTPALTKCRWMFMPLFDGTHFLYYDDGHFFTYDMATGQVRQHHQGRARLVRQRG